MVMDSCQYKMCGADYFHEFGYGKLPKTKSCSGECDAAAYRLVSADGFKRDFLWGQCSQMCSAKYKQMDYKGYAERLTCMDECFSYYEYISPNRDVARSCIHSACGEERLLGGQPQSIVSSHVPGTSAPRSPRMTGFNGLDSWPPPTALHR